MAAAGSDGRRWWPPNWWSVLRVGLVVVWVVWAAATWWCMPRPGTLAEARADLAAGRLVAYAWGNSWQTSSTGWWHDEFQLIQGSNEGPVFVWRTSDHRVRHVEPDQSTPVRDPVQLDGVWSAGPEVVGPEAVELATRLRAAGTPVRSPVSGLPGPVPLLVTLAAVVVLGVLVFGPAPVTGTRWFWFWLFGLSMGLGVLYWLAREHPWRVAARRPTGPVGTDPPGTDPRRRWYLGLAVAIVGSLAVSLLVFSLQRVLGEQLVPCGPDGCG
ncbi:hypothetical protein [Micromonospora yangpuensis]|nr:hypothetical protein [Micromonospora yangpuensis]